MSKSSILLSLVPVGLAIPVAAVALYPGFSDMPPFWAGASYDTEVQEVEPVEIVVKIDWGEAYSGRTTKAGLEQAIYDNLTFRTDEFVFQFNDVPGPEVGITFEVSHNVYGPFPPNAWLDGMVTSLVALQAVEIARERWGS